MATHSIEAEIKTAEQLTEELYGLVGKRFPVSLQVTPEGRVVGCEFDDEWKEGGTTAVEKTDDNGQTFIDFQEDYTDKKLTASERKKVQDWASAQINPS
jgi:hypothetical protein